MFNVKVKCAQWIWSVHSDTECVRWMEMWEMSGSKCVKVKSVKCEDVELLNKSILLIVFEFCWLWLLVNVKSETVIVIWFVIFVKLICEWDSWMWIVNVVRDSDSWSWFVNDVHESDLWMWFMNGFHESDSWMSSQIWSCESPASDLRRHSQTTFMNLIHKPYSRFKITNQISDYKYKLHSINKIQIQLNKLIYLTISSLQSDSLSQTQSIILPHIHVLALSYSAPFLRFSFT